MALIPRKKYLLPETGRAALEEALLAARTLVRAPLEANSRLIADLYSNRDPNAGMRYARVNLPDDGVPLDGLYQPTEVTDPSWGVPETTANLFLSRVLHIVASIAPGTPSPHVKARSPGAQLAVETQNEISRWAADAGGLDKAMTRAAFLGLTNPHFGVKLVVNERATRAYERASFQAVEPRDCGWEPFLRRFTWHTYRRNWAELPAAWKRAFAQKKKGSPAPWDIVAVTEVYHEGFPASPSQGKHPMSIWVSTLGGAEEGEKGQLGCYLGTVDIPAVPLVIGNFLEPAPGEDTPNSEVASWIPPLRQIVQTLLQLYREVTDYGKVVVYDSRIDRKLIQEIAALAPGQRIWIPIDTDLAPERGVGQSYRPAEHDSYLKELLAALNAQLAIFDDTTGVTAIERGTPLNPEKSATEAQIVQGNGSRRNRRRLEVISDVFNGVFRAHHAWQRELYGSLLTIPNRNGHERTLVVPDPEYTVYAFQVDPIELEHLSRRGELESALTFLQQVTQTLANFRGSIPRVVREALILAAKAMGLEDSRLMLDQPIIEEGPQDRLIAAMMSGGKITVLPTDDHEQYLPYYQAILQKTVENPASSGEIDHTILMDAIQKHQGYLERAQLAQVGQLGAMSAAPAGNVAAPALAAGKVPLLPAQ